MKLKVGQRVVLPRVQGGMDITRERPGTVVEEYRHFYMVQTDIGYMESVPKHGTQEVKIRK